MGRTKKSSQGQSHQNFLELLYPDRQTPASKFPWYRADQLQETDWPHDIEVPSDENTPDKKLKNLTNICH